MDILVEEIATPMTEDVVAYATEKSEGIFLLEDGELKWHASGNENVDFERPLHDGIDDHFAPALEVELIALDA